MAEVAALYRPPGVDGAAFGADKARAMFARIPAIDERLRQAAAVDADVVVRGEPGSGKAMFARALHACSARACAPFVPVVCGSVGGAAVAGAPDPRAWLAAAGEGSLFLDEIADLSLDLQLALVRALQVQDGAARDAACRVGPRLVCSSARGLEAMVQRGEFRADLYYRVHVVVVHLPAVRSLVAREIEALVDYFLERHNATTGRRVSMTAQALRRLQRCRWPGNLRELENCIENAATLARDDLISIASLPCSHCLAQVLADPGATCADALAAATPQVPTEAQARRKHIIAALERCGWVQAKAARLLNITPRQMGYALQKYDIEVRKF